MALGGVVSRNLEYRHQIALLDKIVKRENRFQGTAYTIRLNQYQVSGFVYQDLYGAASLHTRQPELAVALAETKLSIRESETAQKLCQIPELIGYPEPLNGRSSESWEFIAKLAEPMSWVAGIFGDEESYLESLVAYYCLLNIHEFCLYTKEPENRGKYANIRLDITLSFLSTDRLTKETAYSVLVENKDFLIDLFVSTGMSKDNLNDEWN